MASTKEMQARAKQRKLAQSVKFQKPQQPLEVNEGLIPWFNAITEAINKHTDWKEGYTATEEGSEAIMALLVRNHKHRPNDSEPLLNDLVKYRAFLEDCFAWKYQLNADELRYNSKSPTYLKYKFGILDSVIGAAMFAFGRAEIKYVDMNQFA